MKSCIMLHLIDATLFERTCRKMNSSAGFADSDLSCFYDFSSHGSQTPSAEEGIMLKKNDNGS